MTNSITLDKMSLISKFSSSLKLGSHRLIVEDEVTEGKQKQGAV